MPALDDVPLLLPTAVISGQLLVERTEYADDPAELHDYGQYWFAPGPEAVVLSIETNIGQQAPAEGDVTFVPGWDRALFVPTVGGYAHLWLAAPSGSVSIWAHGLDRNDLAVIAGSLVRRAAGPGWDIGSLPHGLVAIHEGWSQGAAARTIRSTGEEPSFEMSIIHGVPSTITTPGWFDNVSIDLIDISGHQGVLWQADGRSAVTWSPEPDLTVVLGYSGSADTATELARSVQPVDQGAWLAHTTLAAPDDGCNSMFC
jgi:hypothetical protein